MSERDIGLYVVGVTTALIAWLLKELWAQHVKLRDSMNDLQMKLPTEFASKHELAEIRSHSLQKEDRIHTRIDRLETDLLKRMDACTESVNDLGLKIGDHFATLLEKLNSKADR